MKILLLGLSGSGKTTIAKEISILFSLNLYEADDEVKRINGGVWPESDDIITKGFEIANAKALIQDDIVYVISWLSEEEINKFLKSNFIIFETHAEFEELVRRKIKRDKITPKTIEKFKLTYIEYFNTILNKDMTGKYRMSIDTTNLTKDDLFEIIINSI